MFPLSWVWWLARLVKILVSSDPRCFSPLTAQTKQTVSKLSGLPVRFVSQLGPCSSYENRSVNSDRKRQRSPKPLLKGELLSSRHILLAFRVFPVLLAAVLHWGRDTEMRVSCNTEQQGSVGSYRNCSRLLLPPCTFSLLFFPPLSPEPRILSKRGLFTGCQATRGRNCGARTSHQKAHFLPSPTHPFSLPICGRTTPCAHFLFFFLPPLLSYLLNIHGSQPAVIIRAAADGAREPAHCCLHQRRIWTQISAC